MKTKNKILSIVFVVLFVLVSLITSLFEVTFSAIKKTNVIEASAKAATDFSDPSNFKMEDENFGWYDGASIQVLGENRLSGIQFAFTVNNTALYKFNHEKDQAIFYFTVCRATKTRYIPIYQYIVYSTPEAILTGHVQIEIEDVLTSEQTLPTGAVHLYPAPKMDTNITRSDIEEWADEYGSDLPNNQYVYYSVWNEFEDKMRSVVGDDFFLDSYHIQNDVGDSIYTDPLKTDNTPCPNSVKIVIDVNSPFSQYCVVGGYQLKDFSHTDEAPWWKPWEDDVDVYNDYKGTLKGPTRSIRDCLVRFEEQGTLENVITDAETLEEARAIIDQVEIKTITLSYLKQIGKSPFASREEKTITVPIVRDKVSYDDVLEALDVETLTVLGAGVKAIEYESASRYNVTYLSSVYVEAKSTDGNKKNYYLNLDKSLYWYYKQYVDDGIFEEDLIEFMLNDAKVRHPELGGYEAIEIYGLWGYAVVPETNSFNSLFTEAFDIPTNFSGTYFHFSSHDFLTKVEYTKLLEEYKYGYIERLWEKVKEKLAGDWSYECTHYLFYADPKYQAVNIGENGGALGEEGGAIKETVKDGVDWIRKGIEEDASWWRWTKAIIAIVGVGAGALGIVYVLVKIGVIGGANGSAKTKPKKKKK